MKTIVAAAAFLALASSASAGVLLLEDRNDMTGGTLFTAVIKESKYNAYTNSHSIDIMCGENGALNVRWYLDSVHITDDQARRPVQWRIDDGEVRRGRMADLVEHLDALRSGNMLYVRLAEGLNYRFPLAGSAKALSAFRTQCGA